jgi:hypothetical protein
MTDIVVIVAAVVVAVAGFVTVRRYLVDQAPAPAVASVVTVGTTAEQQTPEGISPALYRTLQAQGSAWTLSTDQAETYLPAAVVRVLESYNVALRVPTGSR